MLGIFDSGIGGLLLASALETSLPGQPQVYFGDTAFAPYGDKPAAALIDRCRAGCRFLLNEGARAILLACHTASSAAAEVLARELPVALLTPIGPVAQAAVQASTGGRIGIISTRTTIASGAYEAAVADLAPGARLLSRPCPLLVPLVEEDLHAGREGKMILRRYLRPLRDQQIDTLIPACTHYQPLHPLIQARIGRRVRLIDPLSVMTTHTAAVLGPSAQPVAAAGHRRPRYFVTALTNQTVHFAERLLKRQVELIEI